MSSRVFETVFLPDFMVVVEQKTVSALLQNPNTVQYTYSTVQLISVYYTHLNRMT